MESSTERAENKRMQELMSLLAACRGEMEVRNLVTLAFATWLAGFKEQDRDSQIVAMAIAAEKTVPHLDRMVGGVLQ